MATAVSTGRRGEILDAALACFTRLGYSGTTIEDVVRASGASVGSIYHHFGGKERLAAALYVEGLADYQRGFLDELQAERSGGEDAVKALVRHHIRWVRDNPDLARYLLSSREAEVVEASSEALRAMNRELFEATRRWQERWSDEVRELPLGLLHAIVIGPAQELARHWLAGREKHSIEKAEPVLADAAWKAVRA